MIWVHKLNKQMGTFGNSEDVIEKQNAIMLLGPAQLSNNKAQNTF